MRKKIRMTSELTPKISSFLALKIFNRFGIVKEPIIIPIGAIIANPPIMVVFIPRDSRIIDKSGVNKLIVIP